VIKIGLLGYGAIARYLLDVVPEAGGAVVGCAVCRKGKEAFAETALGVGVPIFSDPLEAVPHADVFIDCAGHQGLKDHGSRILRSGKDLITLSIGALADQDVLSELKTAAADGGSRLHLASGAIGGLDALSSATVGKLEAVNYTGRKPPSGWRDSAAEATLDLDNLTKAAVHFSGNAREAALRYPKNANVAAAVALAGIGFERTSVTLIADPQISDNKHELSVSGEFGSFEFAISGKCLESNPKTSALAAMSVVKKIADRSRMIVL